MRLSIFHKQVVPFLKWFAILFLTAIATDSVLHMLKLEWIGRWLGIPGTIFILLSFIYSMRKRKMINFGKPKTLLTLHEVFTWTGSLMILVHAGIHFYALLPWLALVTMIVSIISGMTGAYLLKRSKALITSKKDEYIKQGVSKQDIERKLFWDTTTFNLMKQWRTVHIPITLLFATLSITHILSILFFWEWR